MASRSTCIALLALLTFATYTANSVSAGERSRAVRSLVVPGLTAECAAAVLSRAGWEPALACMHAHGVNA
jgi:hypothetical protein